MNTQTIIVSEPGDWARCPKCGIATRVMGFNETCAVVRECAHSILFSIASSYPTDAGLPDNWWGLA